MAQQTLEDAAEKHLNFHHDKKINDIWRSGVQFGVKWQEKRMYSYMEEYADYCLMCSAEKTLKIPLQPKKWFEQHKK